MAQIGGYVYGSRPLPFLLFQMMVDGVNSVPTNPYAAMSQLSGLAEVIVDAGKKATPHQATIGDD